MLDRDAIVVIDAGDFGSYAGRVIDSYVPGAWLDSGPFGCLGSGPGYALAAKLARPDRQVVLLQGDGAFGFSGMEWDTLIRHDIQVVSVIGNNGIWALEKHPMEMLYGYSVVAELRPGTRYDEVVRALGGHGELVSTARPSCVPRSSGAFGIGATRSGECADRSGRGVSAAVGAGLKRAAYRCAVAKASGAKPGRLSSKFWKLLGASTERFQNRSLSMVEASSEFDEKAADLDDEQLRKATQLLELDDLAESDDIPQFLAIAREAAERTTGLRPFDVQLLGALRMLDGDVVEMATGEGKTLSGAIAAAGYALAGRNVHVVTINDYLARRDAEWMGPMMEAMGLSVGWITADSTAEERRKAYECNITYASVNEIGFDVLRDQLVTDVDDLVSPNPDVALIDEADSVLVDEALVPLVLAGTTHRETPKVEIIRARRRTDARQGFRHRRRQPQRAPHRGRRREGRSETRWHRPLFGGTRRHHADGGERRACMRTCSCTAMCTTSSATTRCT